MKYPKSQQCRKASASPRSSYKKGANKVQKPPRTSRGSRMY